MGIALYICGLTPIFFERRTNAADGMASPPSVEAGIAKSGLDLFGNLFRLRPASPPPAEPEAAAPPAIPPPLERSVVGSLIRASAQRNNVPEAFVKSIVAAESNFNSNAISPKGAIGLMQLMPETAREYGGDPAIPEQNVEAGTRYLRCLMEKYRRRPLSHVIAAYNAGPGSVDHYRGVPPFRETRGYVTRVMGFLRHFIRESADDVTLKGTVIRRSLRKR
jgi:soluble lytic murein transglycosylase-like protein